MDEAFTQVRIHFLFAKNVFECLAVFSAMVNNWSINHDFIVASESDKNVTY